MKLQTKIKIIRWVEKLLRTGSPVSPWTKGIEIPKQEFPVIRIQQSISILKYDSDVDTLKRHKSILQDRLWDVLQHAIMYEMTSDDRLQASIWIVDRRNQEPAGEITWQSGNRTLFDENGDMREYITNKDGVKIDVTTLDSNKRDMVDTDTQLDIKRVLTDKNKEGLDVPPDNE